MTKNTFIKFTNAVNTVLNEGRIPPKAKQRFIESLTNQIKNKKTMNPYKLNIKNENRNGAYLTFYANGQMASRAHYKNDKRHGSCERWYENGQMRYRENRENGERNGVSERWYENGQMSERSNWKGGELDGLVEEWYENGQMRERSNWKDGKRVEALPVDPADRGTPAPRQDA